MDRHARWLRSRVIASLGRQCLATALVVAPVTAGVLRRFTDIEPLSVILAAILAGQLAAMLRFAHGATAGPVPHRYVEQYIDQPYEFVVASAGRREPALLATEPHAVAERLDGYEWTATLFDPHRAPTPIHDIFRRTDAVVASISRASGAVTLYTPLSGNRILVTDGWPLPPHERLVVNTAPSTDFDAVVAFHLATVAERVDIDPHRSVDHTIVEDVFRFEHEAYCQLGSWIAPFFELRSGRRPSLRLRAPITAATLRTLDEHPRRIRPRNRLIPFSPRRRATT